MNRLGQSLATVAEAVLAAAPELNRLDGVAGDGDLGVTMSTAAQVVLEFLPELDGRPPVEVFRTLGAALARRAPSTSGTLVATALLRVARDATEGVVDGAAVARLLGSAAAGVAERGKAEVGAKTMLDALAPAATAARAAVEGGASVSETLARAAEAAEAGARATVSMQPRHGRAGWLHERSMGHEDAGARLVAIVLGSAAKSAEEAATTRGDN